MSENKSKQAKRMIISVLLIATGILTIIKPPFNELCKYRHDKPGIVVYFKYDYSNGKDSSNQFKTDIKTLKELMDQENIHYRLEQTLYALREKNKKYLYTAYGVIETENEDLQKTLNLLKTHSYVYDQPITLMSIRCDHNNVPKITYSSGLQEEHENRFIYIP